MEREKLIDDEHCDPNLKSFPAYFDNSSYIIYISHITWYIFMW